MEEKSSQKKEYWYQKQLRILQTVLRENDLAGYDADAVIDYMKITNSNCLVINAGSVIDFFPNSSLMGRPNRFLEGQDILAQLTKKCHIEGMHILARVDFRGVEKERYERKPDWFGENADGSALTGWNDRIYRPCYTSIYGSEYAENYVKMLLNRYDLDGIWENCVTFGYGPCYCKKCRESYRTYSGKEIPSGVDYHSEIFREYREWKAIHAKGHMDRIRKVVKSFGGEKAYVSEIFGMFHASSAFLSGIDLYDAKDQFDFLVSPYFLDGSGQPDKKYEDLDQPAMGIRFLKAIAPQKRCVALTGGNGTKWRYVKAPSLENRIWMWETISAGGEIWNTYFNGQSPASAVDRRNAYAEKDIYRFMKENEEYLDNQIAAGEVGIFFSRASRECFGRDEIQEDEYGSFIRGAVRILSEYHIPYRFVPDLDFSLDKIETLSVLLLPNTACLSETHMQVIRRFVKGGGGLVASFSTSLYDENGKKRQDYGLRDLLGCSFTGIIKDTQKDCYQKVRTKHPVLAQMDIQNTDMIMNEGKTLLCRKQNDAYTTVCTYVPQIENQPPEHAWIPVETTEYPTILAGCYGKGRVVYFANQAERSCYVNGHEDLICSYFNAIAWVKEAPFLCQTNAPGSVHLSMTMNREYPEKIVLFLVNTTLGTGRPARVIVPVYNIYVKIKATGLLSGKFLWQEEGCSVCEEEGEITVSIPCLKEFVSVYLELNEGLAM